MNPAFNESPDSPRTEAAAPWSRIALAAPEAWVEDDPPYFTALHGADGAHFTQLLLTRQIHVGAGKSFHSTAVRLETSEAAQQKSIWSLPLDPHTQRLTLHWLRVVRDGQRVDHLQRERLQLVPRETQPERRVIDTTWSVVGTLEVCPGDVIEAGYTYETTHPVRPGACEVFFTVPPHIAVGHYRLIVLSDPSDPDLAWKASTDAPARHEKPLSNGLKRWIWEGSQANPHEPEPLQPKSFLNYIWIQVSNLGDARELATRITEAWAIARDETGMAAIEEFARPALVDEAAVLSVIQHIQDEFRHVSVDLDAAGWIPAAPGVVAGRHFGASNDLVWMTTAVLRHWGLAARPILVSTELGEAIASLLPMASLFDHAVIEVAIAGNARWFDVTEQAQGGDYSSRSITWFGCGLPLDADDQGVIPQPGKRPRGVYAIHETLLLDSRVGQGSMVEHYICAEGSQADQLRLLREMRGAEQFAKDRARLVRRRYGKARRVGMLQWRDDRGENVCELVEAFEVKTTFAHDEFSEKARFTLPPDPLWDTLLPPENKPRHLPLAMPFPFEFHHEITVKAPSLVSGNKRHREWTEPGFSASMEESRGKGAWTKAVHVTVIAPEIPPERLTVHRRQLNQVFKETEWRIKLPWGQTRIHRGSAFGTLPQSENTLAGITSPERQEERARPLPPAAPASHAKSSGRGWRRRRASKTIHIPTWAWRVAGVVLVLIFLAALRACRSAIV